MRAETDQHDADRRLDRPRHALRNRAAQQNGGASEDEQRQRMAEPPGQPVPDDVTDTAAARGDAGDGGDMIGFERMLHAQQKPKPQNSEHTPPARSAVRSNTKSRITSGPECIQQDFHGFRRQEQELHICILAQSPSLGTGKWKEFENSSSVNVRFAPTAQPNARLPVLDAAFHSDDGGFTFGDQEAMGFGACVATAITEKNGGVITNSAGCLTPGLYR